MSHTNEVNEIINFLDVSYVGTPGTDWPAPAGDCAGASFVVAGDPFVVDVAAAERVVGLSPPPTAVG